MEFLALRSSSAEMISDAKRSFLGRGKQFSSRRKFFFLFIVTKIFFLLLEKKITPRKKKFLRHNKNGLSLRGTLA